MWSGPFPHLTYMKTENEEPVSVCTNESICNIINYKATWDQVFALIC